MRLNDKDQRVIGIVLPHGYDTPAAFGRDCGVKCVHGDVVVLAEAAQDALCDAAQFIDAVKQDAEREGWWTTWDQEMRGKITNALQKIDELERYLNREE